MYVEQTWDDYNPLYPASAARFVHMEAGISDAHEQLAADEPISVAAGFRGEMVPGTEPAVWGTGTRSLGTPGRTHVMRYVPKRAWNLALAKWDVTTAATANDSVELALYNSDLTTRIATSGVQTSQLNALGIKGVPFVVDVDPALVYYLAFKAPVTLGGTGASVNGRATSSPNAVLMFGSTVPDALAGFIDGLASPLPTSITAGSVNWTAVTTFPLIALREV
jgi:hypothetical protein